MLRSQAQVLLVALLSSALLVQVNAAPRKGIKKETKADLADEKELAQMLMLNFMAELRAARDERTLPELDEEQIGVREEVMRRHIPLTQRERKAGCRNFFWKTFTSC